MTKLLLLPVLLGLILCSAARAQSKEDAAIQKRHDEWCEAWNKHDAKLMAGFFVGDGDLINPFGRHAKGTAEIEKRGLNRVVLPVSKFFSEISMLVRAAMEAETRPPPR